MSSKTRYVKNLGGRLRLKTCPMGSSVIDPGSEIPYHTHEEAIYIPPKLNHQIIDPNDHELWFVSVYIPRGPEQAIKTLGRSTEPIRP